MYAKDLQSSMCNKSMCTHCHNLLYGDVLPHKTLYSYKRMLQTQSTYILFVFIEGKIITVNERWFSRPILLSFRMLGLDVLEAFTLVKCTLQWKIERIFRKVLRQRLDIWVECMCLQWYFLIFTFIVELGFVPLRNIRNTISLLSLDPAIFVHNELSCCNDIMMRIRLPNFSFLYLIMLQISLSVYENSSILHYCSITNKMLNFYNRKV